MTDRLVNADTLAAAADSLSWEAFWVEGTRDADGSIEVTFDTASWAAAILAAIPEDPRLAALLAAVDEALDSDMLPANVHRRLYAALVAFDHD